MWTAANRGRMAAIEKKTRRYPTDMTDEEWSQVEPLLPKRGRTGRRRRIDLREVLNAIRYLARTGCGWRMLPVNFPPWQTVYWWFRRFVRLFLFRTIHDLAVMIDRERAGREASPSGVFSTASCQGTGPRRAAQLRRRQENRRPQASCCRRHRWPAAVGEPHARRYLRQCRRTDGAGSHP